LTQWKRSEGARRPIAGSVVGEGPQMAEIIRTQLPKRIADQWSEGKTNIMKR